MPFSKSPSHFGERELVEESPYSTTYQPTFEDRLKIYVVIVPETESNDFVRMSIGDKSRDGEINQRSADSERILLIRGNRLDGSIDNQRYNFEIGDKIRDYEINNNDYNEVLGGDNNKLAGRWDFEDINKYRNNDDYSESSEESSESDE